MDTSDYQPLVKRTSFNKVEVFPSFVSIVGSQNTYLSCSTTFFIMMPLLIVLYSC